MDIVDIILLSIALGMDCLVVSFSQGLIFRAKKKRNALKLAVTMGLFQGLMPVIGYVATDKIHHFIVPYSKWIVFTLFLVLGLHFIFEAFSKTEKEQIECIGLKCLITFGIATSIDALIAGAPIKLTASNLSVCCLTIGIISFIMSLFGFWVGNFVKNIPSKYLQITGGIVLIILAIKNIFI